MEVDRNLIYSVMVGPVKVKGNTSKVVALQFPLGDLGLVDISPRTLNGSCGCMPLPISVQLSRILRLPDHKAGLSRGGLPIPNIQS